MQTDTRILELSYEYESYLDTMDMIQELASDDIDFLKYRSYAHNRSTNPDISPERWRSLFPDFDRFEAKYERETE